MSSSGTIVHEAVKVHHQTFKTYRVRVIVAGDATVGKTAITKLLASSGSDYPRNYVMVRLRLLYEMNVDFNGKKTLYKYIIYIIHAYVIPYLSLPTRL